MSQGLYFYMPLNQTQDRYSLSQKVGGRSALKTAEGSFTKVGIGVIHTVSSQKVIFD